jgi:hypothetical protein
MTELPEVAKDNLTDEQTQTLQERLKTLLGQDYVALRRDAHDAREELLNHCDLSEDADTLNTELQWKVEDVIHERIVTYKQIPETHGYTHDAVCEVVADVVEEIMRDVRVTEEDLFIERQQIKTEPTPSCKYDV